jgi:hypothetical protein
VPEDPREFSRELVRARRRRLKARAEGEEPLTVDDSFLGPETTIEAVSYPYTQRPDFTTDGMAYGERVRETFWHVDADGKVVQVKRRSQRTRSGRQWLSQAPEIEPETVRKGARKARTVRKAPLKGSR